MANEEYKDIAIDVGVPSWMQTLARATNSTYYYSSNYVFASVLPTFMQPYYWRYIKPCLNWLDGYVPEIHGYGTGIISTKIGKALISGITKSVVGEKLILKLNEENPSDIDKKNFKEINKWVVDKKFIKPVYAAVGWAMASGTSFLKGNMKADGSCWCEAVRFDHAAVLINSIDEVEDAIFLIRSYTETEKKDNKQFMLCEHRFYQETKPQIVANADKFDVISTKGREPMVEYIVFSVRGTINNETSVPKFDKSKSVKWKELPQEIQKMIKKDYRVIEIGVPQKLGFTNLAVEPLLNAMQDLGVPNAANLGEGMLFEIQDDMIQYEIASTYQLRDMNLGKGTVYLPKSLSFGDTNVVAQVDNASMGGVPNTVEVLRGAEPENQKAIVQQFQIRVDEWQKAKESSIRNIATKWHMSPKIISSYLASSNQMTATQVDSEDDLSIAFITLHRSYFVESINRLLETISNSMGIKTNITVGFATPSVVNKDRVLKREVEKLNNGLTSIDDAIREIYPDLEEEQILKKIEIAKAERKKIEEQKQQEMNFDGTFGEFDNLDKKVDILQESDNLNGQTNNEHFTNPN